MYAIYHIIGSRKTINYAFQPDESAVIQYKRVRRLVGYIRDHYMISPEGIGDAFSYLKAVNTMPRRMADMYHDYIRDLDGD